VLTPKSKTDDLIDKLNALLPDGKIPDEFTLQLLKREARALQKHDAASAYRILGMIAGAEGKKDELEKHHETALKLGVPPSIGKLNFVTSLMNGGFYSAALEYARRVFCAETDPTAIEKLIELNALCLRFEGALKYTEQLIELGGEMNGSYSLLHFQRIVSLLREYTLRDVDLAKIGEIADALVQEKQIRSWGKSSYLCSEGGVDWLGVEHEVTCQPSTVIDMNFELADRLIESCDSAALNVVSYRFVSREQ
jgi:tetratricopeptide (TPR) repeat protein